jgi:hypothetical protein
LRAATRERPSFDAHASTGASGPGLARAKDLKGGAKNIIEPMRVWRLRTNAGASAATSTKPPIESTQTLVLPDKPSIAVLPFENMSGDPEQEYFVDGIAEDVLTTLSKIQDLLVIARNSSFVFKGQVPPLSDCPCKIENHTST